MNLTDGMEEVNTHGETIADAASSDNDNKIPLPYRGESREKSRTLIK
jgi:hypothetical protein